MDRSQVSEQGVVSPQRLTSAGNSSKTLSTETMWDESGFPRRHKAFKIDKDALNERWRSWHRQISSQLMGEGTSWLLGGDSHSGKTQLATECARDVTLSGLSSYYIPFNWMGLEIDSAKQPAATQTVATYGRKLLSPRLLVIDEISFSDASKEHLQFLSNLVCMRHDNCLDTILVTSEDLDAITDKINNSLAQKIRTNDGFVKFGWSSF